MHDVKIPKMPAQFRLKFLPIIGADCMDAKGKFFNYINEPLFTESTKKYHEAIQ
jgi:hypothetical protein